MVFEKAKVTKNAVQRGFGVRYFSRFLFSGEANGRFRRENGHVTVTLMFHKWEIEFRIFPFRPAPYPWAR